MTQTTNPANTLNVMPLTAQAFEPFGDIIEIRDPHTQLINKGNCKRYNDLANLAFLGDGQCGISLFQAKPYSMPHTLDLLERHPLGSQAFIPMHTEPFLVVVAPDATGRPGRPLAFATNGRQAVNYQRNTWHGVLTPVGTDGLFAVIDRIGGSGSNLQEYDLQNSWIVVDSESLLA